MVREDHCLNEHESGQRAGAPDMLQSMGSQRARHELETEQQLLLILDFAFQTLKVLHCRCLWQPLSTAP